MDLNTQTTHVRTTKTTLEGRELERLIAEVVAKQADLNIDHDHVTFKVYISRRDTSSGFVPEAEVTIIEDLGKLPRPVEVG